MRNAPLFQLDAGATVLTATASLAVATAGGWFLGSATGQFGLFSLLLAYLLGLGVAETALRVSGRKRGPRMEAIVGTCTAIGVTLGHVSSVMLFDVWFVVMLVVSTIAAVNRIRYI